MTILLNSQNI